MAPLPQFLPAQLPKPPQLELLFQDTSLSIDTVSALSASQILSDDGGGSFVGAIAKAVTGSSHFVRRGISALILQASNSTSSIDSSSSGEGDSWQGLKYMGIALTALTVCGILAGAVNLLIIRCCGRRRGLAPRTMSSANTSIPQNAASQARKKSWLGRAFGTVTYDETELHRPAGSHGQNFSQTGLTRLRLIHQPRGNTGASGGGCSVLGRPSRPVARRRTYPCPVHGPSCHDFDDNCCVPRNPSTLAPVCPDVSALINNAITRPAPTVQSYYYCSRNDTPGVGVTVPRAVAASRNNSTASLATIDPPPSFESHDNGCILPTYHQAVAASGSVDDQFAGTPIYESMTGTADATDAAAERAVRRMASVRSAGSRRSRFREDVETLGME